ncbi:MAG: response regulator transcription factor [Oscillospiraceae bacterium]|jgi:DNA-binding response OmpR family regulator|nr:response regulator transcription factor [Oscillospiraceae bacterium]
MKKALVCEDEPTIRELVEVNLERGGYEVKSAGNAEEAFGLFYAEYDKGEPFDVCILDVMLPGEDGTWLCRKIRATSALSGIIMLSAKSQEADKVGSLSVGADYYMTKPFSPSELVAVTDSLYRRVTTSKQKPADTPVISGPFQLNRKSRIVTKHDKPLELTQVEFQILEYFIENEDTALDRGSILDRVWGENYYGDEKIVDVNIRRLRIKIEDNSSEPRFIQTVWGFGYKWHTGN